jgi:hypothetical protein
MMKIMIITSCYLTIKATKNLLRGPRREESTLDTSPLLGVKRKSIRKTERIFPSPCFHGQTSAWGPSSLQSIEDQFSIISLSAPTSTKLLHAFIFRLKCVGISNNCHARYMPYSSDTCWLDHRNNIWPRIWGRPTALRITKFFVNNLLRLSLGPKYSPDHTVPQYLKLILIT